MIQPVVPGSHPLARSHDDGGPLRNVMRTKAEVRRTLAQIFRDHFDTIVGQVFSGITQGSAYASVPVDFLRQRVIAGAHAMIADVEDDESNQFGRMLAGAAEARVPQGFSMADMLHVIHVSERVLRDLCIQEITDPDDCIRSIDRCYEISGQARSLLYAAYVRVHEAVLREQLAIVRQLSTPIMPVYAGVLVLPLIGPVDAERAAQITESLLLAIGKERAAVVIIDITGVPAIDERIAGWLTQAVGATRLLGAQVVLVGIGPAIAQTIVQGGVDLGGAVTLADLKAGLEYALAQRGLFIRRG